MNPIYCAGRKKNLQTALPVNPLIIGMFCPSGQQKSSKALHFRASYSAGGRARTGTVSLPVDFELLQSFGSKSPLVEGAGL